MENYIGAITVIKDNVISEIEPFEHGMNGENMFLKKCSENIPHWNKYTVQDKANVLENGYREFENGSVCISWFSGHE